MVFYTQRRRQRRVNLFTGLYIHPTTVVKLSRIENTQGRTPPPPFRLTRRGSPDKQEARVPTPVRLTRRG
jgi:hypothetical protein